MTVFKERVSWLPSLMNSGNKPVHYNRYRTKNNRYITKRPANLIGRFIRIYFSSVRAFLLLPRSAIIIVWRPYCSNLSDIQTPDWIKKWKNQNVEMLSEQIVRPIIEQARSAYLAFPVINVCPSLSFIGKKLEVNFLDYCSYPKVKCGFIFQSRLTSHKGIPDEIWIKYSAFYFYSPANVNCFKIGLKKGIFTWNWYKSTNNLLFLKHKIIQIGFWGKCSIRHEIVIFSYYKCVVTFSFNLNIRAFLLRR